MSESSIVRSDDLRHENRRRVLDALRSSGASSPAKLAQLTGLSAASISSLSAQMADQGLLLSTRPRLKNGGSRGRPQSLIDVNPTAGEVITLSLTIDLISVQRINYAGELLHNDTMQIKSQHISETQLLDACQQATNEMLENTTGSSVQRIGVAFQGVTENSTGTLAWSPMIKHQNVKLGDMLQSKFNLPVSVNNDCRLIAEALRQSAQHILGDSFATVVFSDGVGLGLYIGGEPFAGIHSSALEMGHLRFERNGAVCRCGRQGCIEAYASNYGIVRLAEGQSIEDEPFGRVSDAQIKKLSDAAMAGDAPATQAFAVAGAAVGEGLSTLFTLLDPMPVALVGRSSHGVKLMQAGIKSVFRDQPNAAIDIVSLLHCFEDYEQLLQSGLAFNTLTMLDHQFAHNMHKSLALS